MSVIPWLIFLAVLSLILGALTWLASRTRKRGVGMEVMGPVDLIYRPHTHELNQEIRRRNQQAETTAESGPPSHHGQ